MTDALSSADRALSVLGMANSQSAVVESLLPPAGETVDDATLLRLSELGFLPGETVTVLRRGPGGREPIAVQIGDTVFALRAIEAGCVRVSAPLAAAA